MILNDGECPGNVEEVAESYVMDTLSAEETAAFEEHYVGCDRCAKALQKAGAYVDAMEAAAAKLRAGITKSAAE